MAASSSTCSSAGASEPETFVLTARGVRGQTNSLVCSCPPAPLQHVVFFQGDTQDLRANMEAQYVEISRWKDFCLERTCLLLRARFPGSAVWVVRPSRMLRNLFSCFHHFVSSSITGVPEYDPGHGALFHTEHLVRDAVRQAAAEGRLSAPVVEVLGRRVVLVGFSKGCVVLNQIVHELFPLSPAAASGISPKLMRSYSRSRSPSPSSPSASSSLSFNTPTRSASFTGHRLGYHRERVEAFVRRLHAMYWLDAGHSGVGGAYVVDEELLAGLSSLHVGVKVHVTPYQVRCPQRPWIGEEEALFVSHLRHVGASVTESVHFEEEEKSLEKHFMILEEF